MAKRQRTKSQQTRERILRAATKVVGSCGYAKASVTRIASKAQLAAGGFYYYFDTRKDLFDELLPALGQEMIAFITERLQGVVWGIEREVRGFEAYLEFLRQKPEFYRVFSEAYVYAPKAYKTHLQKVVKNYCAALRMQRIKGHLDVADDDLAMLAHFLIGIRNYVSQSYMERSAKRNLPPERTVDLYRKLLAGSIFREPQTKDVARSGTRGGLDKFVDA